MIGIELPLQVLQLHPEDVVAEACILLRQPGLIVGGLVDKAKPLAAKTDFLKKDVFFGFQRRDAVGLLDIRLN